MFPNVCVPDNAPVELEQVGSKQKFWFYRKADAGEEQQWMCKLPRYHAGEDWSEKIAAELCGLLGLPHAVYELAAFRGQRVIVSRRIDSGSERLTLGDELLAGHVNRYEKAPTDGYYINPEYTLDLVLRVLSDKEIGIQVPEAWELPNGVNEAPDVFVGYLLLDAWIGNTDRHDQNWGALARDTPEGTQYVLAPTFDHASSLGRELSDGSRTAKLTSTSREHSIHGYLDKCKSRFVEKPGTKDVMHVRDVFHQAASQRPQAADAWLNRLAEISMADVCDLFEQIPENRITTVAVDFAMELLEINRNDLLH